MEPERQIGHGKDLALPGGALFRVKGGLFQHHSFVMLLFLSSFFLLLGLECRYMIYDHMSLVPERKNCEVYERSHGRQDGGSLRDRSLRQDEDVTLLWEKKRRTGERKMVKSGIIKRSTTSEQRKKGIDVAVQTIEVFDVQTRAPRGLTN